MFKVYPMLPYWQSVLLRGAAQPLVNLDFSGLVSGKDTAFVLGTGYSVNDLLPEEEAEIQRGFSIGVNGWPHHKRIVPSVLLHEAAADSEMASYALLLATSCNYGEGRMPPLIIKDCWAMEYNFDILPKWIRDRAFISSEQFVHGSSRYDVGQGFASMMRTRDFGAINNGRVSLVPSRKTSIVYAMSLCAVLGFRRIVLVGVDFRGAGHFYNVKDDACQPHPIADRANGHPTGLEVVDALVDFCLAPDGIEVLCASPKSVLYERYNKGKDHAICKTST